MTTPPDTRHFRVPPPDPGLVDRLTDAEIAERLEGLYADAAMPPSPPASVPAAPLLPGDTDELIGQAGDAHARHQAVEIIQCLPPSPPKDHAVSADAAAHRLLGIAPRDAVEEMLATQMLALHAAAMDCTRRAMLPGQPGEFRREELSLAAKASRAFAQLADTLDKRRRGGQQKVRVEHVHVHAGGQAIVGSVSTGGRKNVG